MAVACRAVVHRVWRSTSKPGRVRQGCALRVLAFYERDRRTPTASSSGVPPSPAAPSAAAPAASILQPTHNLTPSTLLSPDRVQTLPPAALAAALVEHSQCVVQGSVRATDGNGAGGATALAGGDPRLFDAVFYRLRHGVSDFDAGSLVTVLHAFGLAGGRGGGHRDVLAICCATLAGQMGALPPADLTRLAAACAALDLHATDLLAGVCSRAAEPGVLPAFSPADLTALLVALSQLQHRSPALYGDAAEVLATHLQTAAAAAVTDRGAAQLEMGVGRGGRGKATLGADSRGGPGAAGAGPGGAAAAAALVPEQAAAAVWALAAAELYHRLVFDAAGALLMDRLDELDGKALAKIAWSYATVRSADESHRGLWDRDLFDSIAEECLERGVSCFPPRALVTLIWAFASLPHYDGRLFDVLCTALTPRVGSLAASDVVAVAWAVQRVGHSRCEGLMAELGEAALRAADRLNGDDLTTLAMAFPAAKAYSDPFFKYLVSEAQARPQFFGQVALLDIIRLISRVQHRDPQYYGAALQVLLEHVHKAFLNAPVDKAGCMNPFRFG